MPITTITCTCMLDYSPCRIHEKLGSGNFGCVMKCVYRESSSSERDVAAKTLKLESSTTDEIKFLQEAAIMGQFYHPNVVELLGVVTKGNPVS